MIPNVPLVTIMHPFLIRSLNIQLPRLFGGIVATCFEANNVPRSLNQVWKWVKVWIPNGTNVHFLGLAATCWAIWKTRKFALKINLCKAQLKSY